MTPTGKWSLILLATLGLTYGSARLATGGGTPEANRTAPQPQVVERAAQPATPAALEGRAEIVRRIVASSCKIILGTEDKAGAVNDLQSSSGVVIYSEQGPKPWSLVLTNSHAVNFQGLPESAGVYMTYVAPTGRRVLRAKVVARGDQNVIDLALVRVDGVALPAVEFEDMGKAQLGTPILVASSPFGRELSITSGIISQAYLSGPPRIEQACAKTSLLEPTAPGCPAPRPLEEIFKTDAPICYGSSGGGVFLAASGKLVGLVESYQTADIVFRAKAGEEYKVQIPVPGESFLISANKIAYFLEQNGFGLKGPAVLLTATRP